ncbi:hypothetical protein ZWY2020_018474 [Hordeum vulgare]|nr:hypothetical protein ZWY2020_018474 [Hordeum vulgare]
MKICKTVSTCTPMEEAQGTHVFDILSCSKHRAWATTATAIFGPGFSTSAVDDWAISFFPDGFKGYGQDYISVYLVLVSNRTKLRASCDMRLVDRDTGCSFSVHKTAPRIFNPADFTRVAPNTHCFLRRDEIEGSAYLRDDRLTIECVVTVFNKPPVTETKSFPKIDMPPADMTEHVAKLLEEKKDLMSVSLLEERPLKRIGLFSLCDRLFSTQSSMGQCGRRGRGSA